jgi:hypothetical protein
MEQFVAYVIGLMVMLPLLATIIRFWYRAASWVVATARKVHACSVSQEQPEA